MSKTGSSIGNPALFILLLLLPLSALTQKPESDEQLAAHYFQKGEYEKAQLYYKKLVDKNPRNETYFEQYIKTQLEMEKYEEAEKSIKERIDRRGGNPSLQVELGRVYEMAGEERNERKAYEKAIEELPPNREQIRELAKLFIEKDEAEYALKSYKKGEKLLRGRYDFSFEKARTYGMMGEKERMIESYLDLLERNRAYLQSVQNGLDRAMNLQSNSGEVELLRKSLLKRIQRNPEREVYAEMLIWQYVQADELQNAYRQAKALDRRRGEEGRRLMQLARMARNEKEWETARDCYRYVVKQGPSGANYMQARMELLEVMDRMVTEGDPSRQELLELEEQYHSALDDLGRSSRTASIMKEWAHLKGFYLDEPDSAISILKSTIQLPDINEQTVAECKLELGDQLLLSGDVWDASLYYSQVEKAHKHDPLGHKAKFKNAKISFYTGNFEWAQAQLDVLKASTSKLIANDAMDLSLLISDNFNLDTSRIPMEMFARAHLHLFQKDHEKALKTLDSLEEGYPDHSLSDEIVYQRYRVARDRGEFKKAAEHLQRVIDDFPSGILADNALFRLAELNEERFDDPERAMELYRRLLNEHTASLYVVQARERYRELRGDSSSPPPN